MITLLFAALAICMALLVAAAPGLLGAAGGRDNWLTLRSAAPRRVESDPTTPDGAVFYSSIGAVVTTPRQVPYEDTAVVTFRYGLPKMLTAATPEEQQLCPPTNTACMWEIQLQKLTEWIHAGLGPNNTAVKASGTESPNSLHGHSRRKRAFWSMALSVLPLLTEYVPKIFSAFTNKDPIANQGAVVEYKALPKPAEEDLASKVASLHQAYIAVKQAWSNKSEGQKHTIEISMQAQIDGLQVVVDGLLELATLDASVARCRDGYLPPRLVRVTHLKQALTKLQGILAAQGAEPMISYTNWDSAYSLKSVRCAVDNDKFLINLRIPIKKINEENQLFHITPVPYRAWGMACTLVDKPLAVAVLGHRSFFMPKDFCEGLAFCQVPRDKNPSEVPDCLTPFFPDDEVVTRECVPECHRLSGPIVTEASESLFYVTTDNNYPLEVTCPASVDVVPDTPIGATAIRLPCACGIQYGPKVLAAPKLWCQESNATEEPKIKRELPIQWTRRAALSFLDMLARTPAVPRQEVTLSEAEVWLQEELDGLPSWAGEALICLVAAIVVIAWAILRRCRRKCCCRGRRRAAAQRDAEPGPRAGATGVEPGPLAAAAGQLAAVRALGALAQRIPTAPPRASRVRAAARPAASLPHTRSEGRASVRGPLTLGQICAESEL